MKLKPSLCLKVISLSFLKNIYYIYLFGCVQNILLVGALQDLVCLITGIGSLTRLELGPPALCFLECYWTTSGKSSLFSLVNSELTVKDLQDL